MEQTSVTSRPFAGAVLRLLALLAAGIFWGLAYPNHTVRIFGFFACFALTPGLYLLLREKTFIRYYLQIYVFVAAACNLVLWWCWATHPLGTLSTIFIFSIFVSLPFIVLFPLRRYVGEWGLLLLFPFVWTGWEWIFCNMDLCIPLLFLGNTQVMTPELIQYASITGSWGITFWLCSVNSLLMALWLSITTPAFNRRWLLAPLILLAVPPAWSLIVFTNRPVETGTEVTALLIQPGRASLITTEAAQDENIHKFAELTSNRLGDGADLVVWTETAIPVSFTLDIPRRDYLLEQVRKWNVPLLTGSLDFRNFTEKVKSELPASTEQQIEQNKSSRRNYDLFNSAVLITPELARYLTPGVSADLKTYHKRRLFPFVEFVPYIDIFPQLAAADFALRQDSLNFAMGGEPAIFSFLTRKGEKVKLGTLICFEEFYPGSASDFAAGGAEMLAVIVDESVFYQRSTHLYVSTMTGLRAIESGLPVVRTAAAGAISSVDPYGVRTVYSTSSGIGSVLATVRTHKGDTFFVRHPDWFPLTCLWGALAIAVGFAVLNFMSRRNRNA